MSDTGASASDLNHHSPPDTFEAPDSVVPSLMQVYNTMAQSKTPDGPRLSPAVASASAATYTTAASSTTSTQPPSAEQWNAYAGGTSLPSIPPLPVYGSAGITSAAAAAVTATSTAETTGHGRTLRRKRSHNETATETSSTHSASPTPTTSNSRKSRRKSKDTDARWSKRFTWPEALHRDFVAAIFDVGLKHASPSAILAHMPSDNTQITSERVKSHLQKYRLHRVRSKKEFLASYEAGLQKLSSGKGATAGLWSAGEVASVLTHHTVHEPTSSGHDNAAAPPPPAAAPSVATSPATVETEERHDVLTLPHLTEAEKQSPLGASLGYLMGLFFSLQQQLLAQRAAAAEAQKQRESAAAAAASYDAVVTSHTNAAMAPPPPDPQQPPVVSNPSTRNNLEENNMMKREMQNQMAFQNKMRGLKQQELNKFLVDGHDVLDAGHNLMHGSLEQAPSDGSPMRRPASASIGNAEDFWNTDVMDEQLFEFLMSES